MIPKVGLNINSKIIAETEVDIAMGRENREFYKEIPLRPMPYGQALAILFLVEWKKGHT